MNRRIAAVALALGTVLTLAACGGDDTSATSSSSSSSNAPAGSATPASGERNAADVKFAQGMIRHHAQAIEMSDLLLAKDGVDPAVEEIARDIKAAQAPEMEQMTGWLVGWGEDVPSTGSMGGMDMGDMDMGGMMSQEDMAALEDASGEEASTLFLEQMVVHHNSAVDMAKKELEAGLNEDAKALAEQIIESQSSEITMMTELLAG